MPKSTSFLFILKVRRPKLFTNAYLVLATFPTNPVLVLFCVCVCVIVVMFSEGYEVMVRLCHPVSEEKSKKDSGYRKV